MARVQLIKVDFTKVNLQPSFLQKILENSCEQSLLAGFSLSFQSTRLTAARLLQSARFDGSRFVMFTPNQFCALYRACSRFAFPQICWTAIAASRFCEFYCEEFAKHCPRQTKYYQPFKSKLK